MSYSCPAPTGPAVANAPVDTWLGTFNATSSWTDTVNTCAGNCVAPPTSSTPITRAAPPATQTLTCPAGQTGTWTQARTRTENGTRTTTYTCPAPTGAYTTNPATDSWLGTYNVTGSWVDTTNTCAPSTPTMCAVQSTFSSGLENGGDGEQTISYGLTAPPGGGNFTCFERDGCDPSVVLAPALSLSAWGALCQAGDTYMTVDRPMGYTSTDWVNSYTFEYACQPISASCVGSPPPPPTCGPAPPVASRTIGCPAGQTGSISQTHTWTNTAAPTCWVAAPWATISDTCTPSAPTCVSAPGVPAMNTPGGPQLHWLIACTANWGMHTGLGRPDFAAIKAATPVGGTRNAAYGASPTTGGWQCVSTNGAWLNPTTTGSMNSGLGTLGYAYAEVEWNSAMYTGWVGEQTLNFDQCDLRGGSRWGDCMLGDAGSMPPGLALVNALNVPSTIHSGFYNYTCP